MKNKDIAKVLRKAAQLVEQGEETYSCWALANAARIGCTLAGVRNHPAGAAYAELFEGQLPLVSAFTRNGPRETVPLDAAENLRVLALCLAAAIAENP